MVATVADTHVRSAIDFLRRAGREVEARAVETLLERVAPEAARDEAAPVALTVDETARRLEMGRKAVRNRIESGLLVAVRPEGASEDLVTVASIERFEETERLLELIAVMPGDQDEPLGPGEETLLTQMIEAAREADREE